MMMLSRKKRRKQEREDKKLKQHDHYKRIKGQKKTTNCSQGESSQEWNNNSKATTKLKNIEKKREAKMKQRHDFELAQEKRELSKLEKRLSLKGIKKGKKLPGAFIRDGLDYILNFDKFDDETEESVKVEEELEKQEDTLHSDLEEDLEEDSLNSSGEQEEEEEENGYDETFERDQQESKKAQIISELNSDNDGGPPTKRVKFSCPLVSEGTIVSRKLQGLMNKLNESNLLTIFKSIEDLYKNNSQNEVTRSFCEVFLRSGIQPVLINDKFAMELVMLVAMIHQNIGDEVGASLLSGLVKRLDSYLLTPPHYGKGKECDCTVLLLSHMYNFKIVSCVLIYDVIRKLLVTVTERDLELVVLLLKTCGMEVRKNDSLALKDIILEIQSKTKEYSDTDTMSSRMKFMLQVVSAIRTNNVRKIPQHDPTLLEHMKKLLKGLGQGVLTEGSRISSTYTELLQSDPDDYWRLMRMGKEGSTVAPVIPSITSSFEEHQLMSSLCREQQMNTDVRRTVFSVIMSSEDYIDAFSKLIGLGLKTVQEREMIFVTVHCCLQEKMFNPFYVYLSQKLIEYKRDNQVTFQYCFWDHLKALSTLSSSQLINLQCLLSELIRKRCLSLSILRIVEFSTLNKAETEFYHQLLVTIFSGLSEAQYRNIVLHLGGVKRKEFKTDLYHFIKRQKGSELDTLEQLLVESIGP